MGRNIEIKARSTDLQTQFGLATSLADTSAELVQEDTFFNVPAGRLKLRIFEDGSGELIQYEREPGTGPRECRYILAPISDPHSLKIVLSEALGVRAVVRKKRRVLLCGQTRIHLDEVEGLGGFIELEVVLEPSQPVESGVAVAEDLIRKLGIAKEDLIEEAYVDLVIATRQPRSGDRM